MKRDGRWFRETDPPDDEYETPPIKCPDCDIYLMPLFKDSPVLVCYDCDRRFTGVVS